MSERSTERIEREAEMERMEREIEEKNRRVMARSECQFCGGSVPESDEYSWKYAGAGGVLAGPFCSKRCYWGWLNDG